MIEKLSGASKGRENLVLGGGGGEDSLQAVRDRWILSKQKRNPRGIEERVAKHCLSSLAWSAAK